MGFFCLFLEKRVSVHSWKSSRGAFMQTFSLSCFSSSHREGGVAPDCMDFALKASFPWLQAPFRLRSGVLAIPNGWRRNLICFFICEKSRTFEGVRRMSEATDRPTRTEKPQILKAELIMGMYCTVLKYDTVHYIFIYWMKIIWLHDHTGEDGTPVRASPRRETVYRPQPVCSVSNTAH